MYASDIGWDCIAAKDDSLALATYCTFFIPSQNALRESRSIDDKIIQALNNSIPTASFRGQVDVAGKCRELWQTVRKRGRRKWQKWQGRRDR